MRHILFFLFIFFSFDFSMAQSIGMREQQIMEQRGELYFSFELPQNHSIEDITHIISIDRTNSSNRIFAYANYKEFSKFLELGINYQLEKEASLLTNPQMAKTLSAFIQSWDTYPTYQQYDSLMHKLANDYPSLCRYHVIGTLASGHQLLALQLGDSAAKHEKEVRYFYTSSMHGNELTGYVLMLRFANYLLSNYGQNALVDSLMNNVEIWINPLANPDGAYYYSDTSVYGAKRYNWNMVDLNRNFPDPEDGSHPDGNSWQPETQFFMAFADSLHFTMSANFHGGAEVLNYPWDTWSKLSADDNWWRYVCHQYADTVQAFGWSGYFTGPSSAAGTGVTNGYAWYSISGGRQDYMNYFQRCREVTIELSNEFLPQASTLPNYWNAQYRSLLSFINQARFGLRGVVTDSLTNKALAAKITILQHDFDSSHARSALPYGDYYRLLDSGYYSITVSAPHYYSKTISGLKIRRDSISILNVALVPDPFFSIKELPSLQFLLFPNPVNQQLHITSLSAIKSFKLYSIDGKLVRRYNLNGKKDYLIDVSEMGSGIYLIKLEDTNGAFGYKKLIIQ